MVQVQRDDVQTVQMLVSLGADLLGARDGGGQSMRRVATQHGSFGVVRVLDRLASQLPEPEPELAGFADTFARVDSGSSRSSSSSSSSANDPSLAGSPALALSEAEADPADMTSPAGRERGQALAQHERQPANRLDGYANALDKVALLSTLTRAEKLQLAESLSTEEFGAGDNIVEAGEVADCMYLLESGSASAVKPSPSSASTAAVDVLKTYSRGDFFGELALQSGGVRQATVVATSFSTTVLKLPRSAFQMIVATNAGAAAKLEQEKARYAEASARLLAAARRPKTGPPAAGGGTAAEAQLQGSASTSSSSSDNDPSLAGSPALSLPSAGAEPPGRGLEIELLAQREQQLVSTRAQMAVAREQAEAAAKRTFARETQQLVVSLQQAVQAQAAAEAMAKKASADQQKVEKQSAAIVSAKERDVLEMRQKASEAEGAARQASAAAAKLAEEIARQTTASRTAMEAAEAERQRLAVEVREAMATEAECAAKLQATERASSAEKEVLAAELERVRQRQQEAEDERLKATQAGEVALEEVRQHARTEAERLRNETIAATRVHEKAVAKAQAQAEVYREALEQGKIDALKLIDDSAAVTARTKDQLSAAEASAETLKTKLEAQKLRGIELATEVAVAVAKGEEEKSAANARLLIAESERLSLVAEVSEMALQREEAEVAAGTAKHEVLKLATQVHTSRTQLEAAEQAQAETELENARLATQLKEAVATQLAMEEARGSVALEISTSMAQISASLGGGGGSISCAAGGVEESAHGSPSSLTASSLSSSLRWDSECVWVELFDDENDPYYYNTRTQETTWEMPAEFLQFRREQLLVQQEITQAKAWSRPTANGTNPENPEGPANSSWEACTRNGRSAESPVSVSSSLATGGSRRATAVSPDRELAAPPPRRSGSQSPPVGLPHQETMAAAAAREAKMAAAQIYAAKAAAAAARRSGSAQSPRRGPAMSPGRAEAERFQQEIRRFLRARRVDKRQHEPEQLQPEPAPVVMFGSPINSGNPSRSLSHDSNDSPRDPDRSSPNGRLDGYANALDKVALLSTLTRAEKLQLAESLSTEEFGAGDNIVEAGEAADCMYLLESGSASAVKPSPSSASTAAVDVLKTYSRGDFFGELALQSGGVRQATVVATSFSTTVLKLPRSAFQMIVATNAGAAAKLEQEKARYAEASARLLAAARRPKTGPPAAGGGTAAPSTAQQDVDEARRRQGRQLRQESARTIQSVFRGWRARRHVAKVQVSGGHASDLLSLGQRGLLFADAAFCRCFCTPLFAMVFANSPLPPSLPRCPDFGRKHVLGRSAERGAR
eukprot:COSAG03_NODE_875_length_5530_cov_16.331615_2_plen_1312_part_00